MIYFVVTTVLISPSGSAHPAKKKKKKKTLSRFAVCDSCRERAQRNYGCCSLSACLSAHRACPQNQVPVSTKYMNLLFVVWWHEEILKNVIDATYEFPGLCIIHDTQSFSFFFFF